MLHGERLLIVEGPILGGRAAGLLVVERIGGMLKNATMELFFGHYGQLTSEHDPTGGKDHQEDGLLEVRGSMAGLAVANSATGWPHVSFLNMKGQVRPKQQAPTIRRQSSQSRSLLQRIFQGTTGCGRGNQRSVDCGA